MSQVFMHQLQLRSVSQPKLMSHSMNKTKYCTGGGRTLRGRF